MKQKPALGTIWTSLRDVLHLWVFSFFHNGLWVFNLASSLAFDIELVPIVVLRSLAWDVFGQCYGGPISANVFNMSLIKF